MNIYIFIKNLLIKNLQIKKYTIKNKKKKSNLIFFLINNIKKLIIFNKSISIFSEKNKKKMISGQANNIKNSIFTKIIMGSDHAGINLK